MTDATVSTTHRIQNGQQVTTRRVEIDGEVHDFNVEDGGYAYQGDEPPAAAVRALRAWHSRHAGADEPDPPEAPAPRDRPGDEAGGNSKDPATVRRQVLDEADGDVTPPAPTAEDQP